MPVEYLADTYLECWNQARGAERQTVPARFCRPPGARPLAHTTVILYDLEYLRSRVARVAPRTGSASRKAESCPACTEDHRASSFNVQVYRSMSNGVPESLFHRDPDRGARRASRRAPASAARPPLARSRDGWFFCLIGHPIERSLVNTVGLGALPLCALGHWCLSDVCASETHDSTLYHFSLSSHTPYIDSPVPQILLDPSC
jgi:hypothetical protein